MASASDGKQVLRENKSQVSGGESDKKCEKKIKLSLMDKLRRAIYSKEEWEAYLIEKQEKDNKDSYSKNKKTGCQ
jgi:hypothetical protein